jgi:hypothetical protein
MSIFRVRRGLNATLPLCVKSTFKPACVARSTVSRSQVSAGCSGMSCNVVANRVLKKALGWRCHL